MKQRHLAISLLIIAAMLTFSSCESTSKEKNLYLPESEDDFIFSVINDADDDGKNSENEVDKEHENPSDENIDSEIGDSSEELTLTVSTPAYELVLPREPVTGEGTIDISFVNHCGLPAQILLIPNLTHADGSTDGIVNKGGYCGMADPFNESFDYVFDFELFEPLPEGEYILSYKIMTEDGAEQYISAKFCIGAK